MVEAAWLLGLFEIDLDCFVWIDLRVAVFALSEDRSAHEAHAETGFFFFFLLAVPGSSSPAEYLKDSFLASFSPSSSPSLLISQAKHNFGPQLAFASPLLGPPGPEASRNCRIKRSRSAAVVQVGSTQTQLTTVPRCECEARPSTTSRFFGSNITVSTTVRAHRNLAERGTILPDLTAKQNMGVGLLAPPSLLALKPIREFF